MKIGRIDLAHRLKQYFELAGQMHPELGEGIVVTAQVVDLNDTPFSLDVPFVGVGNMQAWDPLEYVYVIIRPTGLPQNSWASIDQLWINLQKSSDLGAGVYITGMKLTDVPTLSAPDQDVVPMQRANIDGTFAGLPEVDILKGHSATAPPVSNSLAARLYLQPRSTLDLIHVRHRWGLAAGGALVIAANMIDLGITVSVAGRIHYTSST